MVVNLGGRSLSRPRMVVGKHNDEDVCNEIAVLDEQVALKRQALSCQAIPESRAT